MDAKTKFSDYAKEVKTILCFGIDPDLGRISKAMGGKGTEQIAPYFNEITDRLLEEHQIAAIKPNYAYFAQYGFEGLFALENILQRYRGKVPVILDVKRGDIGKTSEAYAKEAYDFWQADSVTISPYMGYDSVAPFIREDKLVYLLCRTSNKGAEDLQELKCGTKTIYQHVMSKAMKWKCGAVVGATSDSIKKLVKQSKGEVPLLIPGVGSQGGDLDMVMKAITGDGKLDASIHRINASSSIAYAFEKRGGQYASAALAEAMVMNEKIKLG